MERARKVSGMKRLEFFGEMFDEESQSQSDPDLSPRGQSELQRA